MRGAGPRAFRDRLARNGEELFLIALAAAVYRPWSAPGLPIFDFSQFLPQLAGYSFASGFRNVTVYLASQGRFAPLQYLFVALDWKAFGTSAAGWHWSYFVVNCAVLILARRVLLKMGIRRSVALATIAIWALMKPFADCWVRPTGENLGLLFALPALYLALDYQVCTGWRRRAFLIAACGAGMLLSKEILVVIIPAIWLASRLENANGALRWAPWTRRDAELAATLATAIVIAAIPIAYVAHAASRESYAAGYGAGPITFASVVERFEAAFSPGRIPLSSLKRVWLDPAWRLLLVLPNLVWLALIADGLASRPARKNWWLVVIGLVWLFSGVFAYLPWPSHSAYYMMPFAFGVVIIAAHSFNSLFGRSGSAGWMGVATAAIFIGLTSIEARNAVRRHDIRVRLDDSVMESLSHISGVDEIVAAVPQPATGALSWGWAKRLARFGEVAEGLPALRARDVSCSGADSVFSPGRTAVLVSEDQGCGMIVPGSATISVSTYERLWPTLLHAQPMYRTAYITRGK